MSTRKHRSDVSWNLFRDFLVIVTYDSFAEAAREMGTVRPAISRKVADLEKALGFSIIERSPGRFGLQLTRRGKVLHRAIQEFDTSLSALRNLTPRPGSKEASPLERADAALLDLQDALEELKAREPAGPASS